MLDVQGLSVSYGKVEAVRAISFRAQAGEIVSIVGPNGAGKSSTVNAIFGITSAKGAVRLDNESILGLSPEKIARRSMRLVPEGRRIFGTLSVAENLMVGLAATANRRRSTDDLESIFARFEVLGRYRDTPAGRLSGGEQQQLAIGRALIGRPSFIALDEPSLGLAPQIVDSVMDLLAQLREEGVTVLLVEQNALRAIELADRSYLMRGGEIVREGDRSSILSDHELADEIMGFRR